MPGAKEVPSMFDIVKQQGETLDEHGNRIAALEEADKEKGNAIEILTSKFDDISNGLTKMENTILKSAQTTQEVMSSQNTQQWELIKILNKGNQEELVRKHELKKTKMEKFWELAGKITMALVGSGGLIIVVLEFLSNK